MGASTFDILARLKLNSQGFGGELNKALAETEKKVGSSSAVIGRNIREGVGDSLRDSAARIPVIGGLLSGLSGPALVAAGGVGAIAAGLALGISEAEALQKSIRALEASIKNVNNTGLSRKQLIDFSDELEGRFAIAQEEILKVEATLSTFEGVAGETFKRTMIAAADLSETFGGDLAGEATKLGTVIQNLSEGSVDGLRKGFKFLGPATLTTIENLVKTGHEVEALTKLLDEIKKTTGDSADARSKGVSGAFFKLGDSVGDTARIFTEKSGAYETFAKTLGTLADQADRAGKSMMNMPQWEVVGRGLMTMMLPGFGMGANYLLGGRKGQAGGSTLEPWSPEQWSPEQWREWQEQVKAGADAGRAAKDRKARNDRDRAEEETRKGILLLPPVDGPVSSGFGRRAPPKAGASSYHPAIDYAVGVGTPVRAGAEGVVIRTGRMGGFGNVVIIDYGNNLEAQFSHLSEALVKPGDVVTRGQVVARTGNTGTSTGPHLDYRVKEGGSYVDPRGRHFKVGEGVGNAYAAFEQHALAEQEAADKKAADAADARRKKQEEILSTMREQLNVDLEGIRFSGLRAQGLDRQADLEAKIAEHTRRTNGQLAEFDELRFQAMAAGNEKEAERLAQQSQVSAGLQEQLSLAWKQSQVYADLLKIHGDRAAVTAEQAAADDAARVQLEDQLATAQDMVKTAADIAAIRETTLQIEGRISGAAEDGAKAAAERKAAAEKWLEAEEKARKEAFELQRDQYQDLADFYERAMRSGGKSIVEDFKDNMISAIASVAAQWTMALLSGQKVSFGSLLQQMGATTNPGGAFNPLSLFGIGGGGGPGLPGFGASDAAIRVHESYQSAAGPAGGAGGGMAGGMGQLAASLGQSMPYVAAGMAATTMLSKVFGIKNHAGGMFGLGGNILINEIIPAKRGSATLGFDPYGELGVGSSRGNSGSRIEAAKGGIGSVAEMLDRIAEALGGSVSGAGSVSLGLRDGKWRGDPTGRGITKTKNGAIDFGEDQEAAIRWAVGEALRDGVVDGISDAAKKILASGQDLERAIEKAAMIEDIPRRLRAQLDPVGAQIEELNEQWEKAVAALREGGASTEEMANAQKLYRLELDQVKSSAREASAGLKDFLASINFGSASPYSLRDQERMARESLQPYLDKIGTGERIDQEKYQQAAGAFLQIERELYGSTGKYFESLDMVMAATGKAIAEIDNAKPIRTYADPFIEKTASNTAATAEILDQLNQNAITQTRLLEALLRSAGGGGGGFIGGGRGFAAASL